MDTVSRRRRVAGGSDSEATAAARESEFTAALGQAGSDGLEAVGFQGGDASPGTLESGGAPGLTGTGPLPVANPFHSERVRTEVELIRHRPATLDEDGSRIRFEGNEEELGDTTWTGGHGEPDYGAQVRGAEEQPRVARVEAVPAGSLPQEFGIGLETRVTGPEEAEEGAGGLAPGFQKTAVRQAVRTEPELAMSEDTRELIPALADPGDRLARVERMLGQMIQENQALRQQIKSESQSSFHSARTPGDFPSSPVSFGYGPHYSAKGITEALVAEATKLLKGVILPANYLVEMGYAISWRCAATEIVAIRNPYSCAKASSIWVRGHLVLVEDDGAELLTDWLESCLCEGDLRIPNEGILKSLQVDVPLNSEAAQEEVTSLETVNQAVDRVQAHEVAITFAARHPEWRGVTIDVKSAFLYAPIRSDTKGTEERIVVKPPFLLVELGLLNKEDRWWIRKALYGLPTSPRDWGRYRDEEFKKVRMTWQAREFQLIQTKSDDALWLLRAVDDGVMGPVEGVLIVYVDDLAVFAPKGLAEEFIKAIQSRWKTSSPEWLGEKAVTFCGVELARFSTGYRMSQCAYIRELLNRYNVEERASVPILKWVEPEPEDHPNLDEVREAQGLTGALLWVSTRTRPDLAYLVSRCGQQATKAPRWSISFGKQALAYLRDTLEWGIDVPFLVGNPFAEHGLLALPRSEGVLELYTDASHSPGGDRSMQSVFVVWCGVPIAWEAIQPLVDELTEQDTVISLLADNEAAIRAFDSTSSGWRNRLAVLAVLPQVKAQPVGFGRGNYAASRAIVSGGVLEPPVFQQRDPSVPSSSSHVPEDLSDEGEVEEGNGLEVVLGVPGLQYEAEEGCLVVVYGDDRLRVPLEGWSTEAVQTVVQGLETGLWPDWGEALRDLGIGAELGPGRPTDRVTPSSFAGGQVRSDSGVALAHWEEAKKVFCIGVFSMESLFTQALEVTIEVHYKIGRQLDSVPATIDVLPAIAEEVRGQEGRGFLTALAPAN
ncbi:RE1 [Symbiodinium sp. CCMP2456]|nr:RE1 [Symbiodinium sp. CCMP2456]